ncbi:MAG TPA: hypothetical protein DEH78_24330 [Solibacterales bacterium]|nr:hypothetical protein [Bryobacterales bacterium]
MIDSLSPDTQRFLRQVSGLQERINSAHQQITSGLKLSAPSDSPDQVGSLLLLRAEMERNTQIKANLDRFKTEVDTAEGVMASAVRILDRVRTLGAQGATFTMNASSRQTLGDEVGSLLEYMVGLANTSVEGRYVFAGDNDGVAPYTLDWSAVPPTGAYGGSDSTREALLPNGSRLRIARTAQELFDSSNPGENVFQAVNALREALYANDQAAIQTSLGALETAGDYLNGQHSFYGIAQTSIGAALDDAAKRDVRLKEQVADIEEADITAAILELEQSRFHYEAALKSRAQIPQQTLFDYLK